MTRSLASTLVRLDSRGRFCLSVNSVATLNGVHLLAQ